MNGQKNKLKVKLNEELMCGICHDCLNRPKTLTECSHTFCQECLEKLFTFHSHEDRLECPKCRQVTILPQGKVAGLPTNYTLQNVAKIIAEQPDGEQESEQVCPKHEARMLDQYCSKCNELLCSECIHEPEHKEHLQKGEIHLACNILPERLDTLSEKLEPATSLATHAEEMKQQVEKEKEGLASNCEKTKGEIEEFFDDIKRLLEERERSLVSAVEENTKMKLAVLEKRSQMLEESKMSALKATAAINDLCQTRDIRTLTEDRRIGEDIQQCQHSLEELEAELANPDHKLILKFKKDTSLESQINRLGKLTECECDTYLKVKHQLTVGRDGKYVPVPSTIQTQYIVAAERNEHVKYGKTRMQLYGNPANSDDDDDIYVEIPSEQVRPQSFCAPQLSTNKTHPSLPVNQGMSNADSKLEASDSGSDSDYEPVAGWGPPLPPENVTRNLARRKERSNTIPHDIKSQPHLQANETELIPPPRETVVVKPVQVINTRELSDNGEVHPYGIHCSSGSDNITITDVRNHCLRQLDKEGTLIEAIGSKGRNDGQFEKPTAVAIGAAYMYVTDFAANGRMQKLSKYGLFDNKCGKKHLRKPCGIAISPKDESVYVSDCRKGRVYIYSSDCKHVGTIGKAAEAGDIQFYYPLGIAFDTAGNLLVVDRRQQSACIWQIDISKPKGQVIAKIGEGYLHHPFGITVTQDGSIVVTEQGNLNCVSVFSYRGELIQCLGKTGTGPGMFNSPSGVAVNSKGQIIVADTYNQRLQVFSLHKEET